jgi:hypothetical protein
VTRARADGHTLRLALVGCGKAKLDRPALAQDLYTGPLFRAARGHVESAYDAWMILSAKHGAVHPHQVLEPYDQTLVGKSVDWLARWARIVDSQVRLNTGYGTWSHLGGRLEVDVFAGAAYTAALPPLWSGLSWTIRYPHHGLQIGERLHAFKTASPPGAPCQPS